MIGPKVAQYQALIADDVKSDTRKLYIFEAFKNDVDGAERSLKTFVERRRAFLLKSSPEHHRDCPASRPSADRRAALQIERHVVQAAS